VEVPEGFWCYHINKRGDIEAYPEDGGGGTKSIAWLFYKFNMPEGDWQFAFASPLSPTEEEAAKYVGWAPTDPKLYREYKKDDADSDYYDFTFRTANESLHSRIKSEGFPHPERVVLLTKK